MFCEIGKGPKWNVHIPSAHLQSFSEDSIYNSLIQHQKETNFAKRDMSLFVFVKGNPLPKRVKIWLALTCTSKSVTSPHMYE